MMMFNYPIILTPDDGTILVTFPDIPEAITFGKTETEALQYAVDALETALSFYVEKRKPLPIPSKIEGAVTICPSVFKYCKLLIYNMSFS